MSEISRVNSQLPVSPVEYQSPPGGQSRQKQTPQDQVKISEAARRAAMDQTNADFDRGGDGS